MDSLVSLADSGIPITTRSQSLMDTFAYDNMRRLQENFQVRIQDDDATRSFHH